MAKSGAHHPPVERVEWKRPKDLPGTQILILENTRLAVRMHHEHYLVMSNFGGIRPWTCHGTRYTNTPGCIAVCEPGDFHACLGDSAMNQRGLQVEPAVFHEIADQWGWKGNPPHLRTHQSRDPGLFQSFATFYRMVEGEATRLERESLLMSSLGLLLQKTFQKPPRPRSPRKANDAIRRAQQYIQENFAQNIALSDLAELMGLSKYQLHRLFSAQVGVPPHTYHLEVRLAQARKLLAGRVAPAEVAARVGFSDQSHFTRRFRRSCGVTPGVYARGLA